MTCRPCCEVVQPVDLLRQAETLEADQACEKGEWVRSMANPSQRDAASNEGQIASSPQPVVQSAIRIWEDNFKTTSPVTKASLS